MKLIVNPHKFNNLNKKSKINLKQILKAKDMII